MSDQHEAWLTMQDEAFGGKAGVGEGKWLILRFDQHSFRRLINLPERNRTKQESFWRETLLLYIQELDEDPSVPRARCFTCDATVPIELTPGVPWPPLILIEPARRRVYTRKSAAAVMAICGVCDQRQQRLGSFQKEASEALERDLQRKVK